MKDINAVLVRKLEELRLCKVQLYCLRVVIPLLTDDGLAPSKPANGTPVTPV